MDLSPGRRASVRLHVADADLATAFSSGDVRVLATPRVVALLEQAAVEAVRDALPGEKTTVGAWIEMHHLAPTPAGETVEGTAVLESVDGRRLEFAISAVDADGREVARGRHRRAIVDRSRFPA
jgi:fluoroacetyl-CoA thioesterase